jgi:hypothetical protein
MHTSTEVQRLRRAYDYESRPALPLAGSAIGLCVVTVLSFAGSRVSAGDAALAERIDGDRGRLTIAQSAIEHSRDVFTARRDARNVRLIRASYAQASAVMR